MSAGLLGIDGGDSLVPCWAKPSGDGAWTLRLHETLGRRGTAVLQLAADCRAAGVDLRGEPAGAIKDGRVTFGPYEVLSVRIARQTG